MALSLFYFPAGFCCFFMDFAFSWILCRYRKNEKKNGHKIAGLKFYSRVEIFFFFFFAFRRAGFGPNPAGKIPKKRNKAYVKMIQNSRIQIPSVSSLD